MDASIAAEANRRLEMTAVRRADGYSHGRDTQVFFNGADPGRGQKEGHQNGAVPVGAADRLLCRAVPRHKTRKLDACEATTMAAPNILH